MDKIDFRRLAVSVEIDGVMKRYEGLHITASGDKSANPIENSCRVEIFNLARETRNYLLTETSPFNENRSRKRVIVEAGRQSTGLTQLFVGDITSASPSQPPDIGLTLEARTGSYVKGNLVARSGKAQQPLSEISKMAADDAGVGLEFEATDKNISNYAFTGGALKQVNQLSEAGGVNAFIDDEVLVVKDINKPRKNHSRLLTKDTGMIGIPEITEQGIKVQFLFDNETVIGGELIVKSELNPAVNGSYEIYKLSFDLSSRDTPWYYTAEAKRH